MKVGLVGVAGVPLGKHKVKDARLDQADKLVKAENKTYDFGPSQDTFGLFSASLERMAQKIGDSLASRLAPSLR